MKRRKFIRNSASAAAGMGFLNVNVLSAGTNKRSGKKPFVGIQMTPYSFYDEGIENVLDVMDESRVNALFIYSTSLQYHAQHWMYNRGDDEFAPHGLIKGNPSNRDLSHIWFKTHRRYYQSDDKFPRQRSVWEYGDKDVFEDLREPAAKRGISLYARVIDGGEYVDLIPGWADWRSVGFDGKVKNYMCPNNPDYKEWWAANFRDLFENHPYLAGLKFGHERGTPLSGALTGGMPDCICPHCLKKAEERGIDVDRTMRGYEELRSFAKDAIQGKQAPPDGYFVTFWRILRRYPEILAWDAMWTDGLTDQQKHIYESVKKTDPGKQVGWHIFQRASFSPFFRAIIDYHEMSDYADFIKPVLYSDPAGARLQRWYLNKNSKTIYGDLESETLLHFIYQVLGYDAEKEPTLKDLKTEPVKGFSPDYLYREVQRCLQGIKPGVKVYSGMGLDIPDQVAVKTTPESAYAAAKASFDAGADGLLVSREYSEMRIENLKAVGKAVDDYFA